MSHVMCAWLLWDAGDLVGVHLTPEAATDARDRLLAAHLADFPADADTLNAAACIEPARITTSGPEAASAATPAASGERRQVRILAARVATKARNRLGAPASGEVLDPLDPPCSTASTAGTPNDSRSSTSEGSGGTS